MYYLFVEVCRNVVHQIRTSQHIQYISPSFCLTPSVTSELTTILTWLFMSFPLDLNGLHLTLLWCFAFSLYRKMLSSHETGPKLLPVVLIHTALIFFFCMGEDVTSGSILDISRVNEKNIQCSFCHIDLFWSVYFGKVFCDVVGKEAFYSQCLRFWMKLSLHPVSQRCIKKLDLCAKSIVKPQLHMQGRPATAINSMLWWAES